MDKFLDGTAVFVNCYGCGKKISPYTEVYGGNVDIGLSACSKKCDQILIDALDEDEKKVTEFQEKQRYYIEYDEIIERETIKSNMNFQKWKSEKKN